MTCIVGLVHGQHVYIGGDSAGVGDWSLTHRKDKKVFRNGEFVFGFTSSFRMGQLLQYKLAPPLLSVDQDVMAYMATDFVDAVRSVLKDGGYAKVKDSHSEEGGTFLVGCRDRLFAVHGDFQVSESLHGFAACGCGSDIALGSMHSTRSWVDPEARIVEALQAADTFSAGVAGPFHIESTLPILASAKVAQLR
jgi:ATP-dependent protease HslVU (ClpYQ) peptidase subunit